MSWVVPRRVWHSEYREKPSGRCLFQPLCSAIRTLDFKRAKLVKILVLELVSLLMKIFMTVLSRELIQLSHFSLNGTFAGDANRSTTHGRVFAQSVAKHSFDIISVKLILNRSKTPLLIVHLIIVAFPAPLCSRDNRARDPEQTLREPVTRCSFPIETLWKTKS